jgi:hypothetical protein
LKYGGATLISVFAASCDAPLYPAFQRTPNDCKYVQKSLTVNQRRPAGNVKDRTNTQQQSWPHASHQLTSSNFRAASSNALFKWAQRKYKTKSFSIITPVFFKFSEASSFKKPVIPTKQRLQPATTKMLCPNMDMNATNNQKIPGNNDGISYKIRCNYRKHLARHESKHITLLCHVFAT